AAPAGRPGDRLLDGFGLLGRGGAAVPCPARDGRRRRSGPLVAALHARPHVDRRRRRRPGRRAPGRGGKGAVGQTVAWTPCGFSRPCPVVSTRRSRSPERSTPATT